MNTFSTYHLSFGDCFGRAPREGPVGPRNDGTEGLFILRNDGTEALFILQLPEQVLSPPVSQAVSTHRLLSAIPAALSNVRCRFYHYHSYQHPGYGALWRYYRLRLSSVQK